MTTSFVLYFNFVDLLPHPHDNIKSHQQFLNREGAKIYKISQFKKITTQLRKVGTVWTSFILAWFRLQQAEELYNMLGHIY